MPRASDTRVVKHSADAMFDLVSDVEAYPQFLPLCEALQVRERAEQGETTILIADMTVAYKFFRETFTTKVTLDRPGQRITADYIDGPFKHLHTRWSFEPTGESACQIDFHIDYEFKSVLLAGLMGAAFSSAFDKFAEAFVTRADQVYGAGNASAAGDLAK